MKKHSWLLIALPLALAACNNNGNADAVDKADSANEAKADNADNRADSGGAATAAPTLTTDKETADFMVEAANGGMMEVQLGQTAQDKGAHERVKAFGAMMVRDHSAANDQMKALATARNVTLPTTLADKTQKHVDDMSKKTGKDFDKDYIGMMVDDHKDDIDKFEKASKNTKDAEVKAFVDKTLPILRAHLDSAKAIQTALKKG